MWKGSVGGVGEYSCKTLYKYMQLIKTWSSNGERKSTIFIPNDFHNDNNILDDTSISAQQGSLELL